jgi:hypothetical protein
VAKSLSSRRSSPASGRMEQSINSSKYSSSPFRIEPTIVPPNTTQQMSENNHYEVSFDTTPALARSAARCYIWRRTGVWLILTFGLAVVSLAMVINGNRSLPVVVLLTLACFKSYLWLRFYLRSDEPFRKMKNPRVAALFDDRGIKMGTDQTNVELSWNMPMRVWKFRPLWIFSVLGSRVYTFIPTAVLSEELQQFIEQKVTSNGGTIA